MAPAVVIEQDVAAEIGAQVAPHRVHVVDPALGVVVLDEQLRALHAVVVRLADFGAAGPRERQRAERVVVGVLGRLGVGELVGDAADVDVEQGAQDVALRRGEVAAGDALRRQREADGGEVLGAQAGDLLGRALASPRPVRRPRR